jgi:hypothetical protein
MHSFADYSHSHPIYDPGHNHDSFIASARPWFASVGAWGPIDPNVFGWRNSSHNYTGIGIYGSGTGVQLQAAVTGVRVWDGVSIDWTGAAGLSTPHNNMQPTTFVNAMVKF